MIGSIQIKRCHFPQTRQARTSTSVESEGNGGGNNGSRQLYSQIVKSKEWTERSMYQPPGKRQSHHVPGEGNWEALRAYPSSHKNDDTFLSSYWVEEEKYDVVDVNIRVALKFTASELNYPELKVIPIA